MPGLLPSGGRIEDDERLIHTSHSDDPRYLPSVPSFAKPILLSLAGALGLYGLGVLFVNMYLQSRGVQSRVQDAVTRATGLPVTMNRTYYTPWSGLAISGVAVPPVHPEMESPLVSIESVKIALSLPALLQGQIYIKDIVLIKPRLVSRQNKNGSWAFNQTPEIAGPTPQEAPTRQAITLPTATPPPSSPGAIPVPSTPIAKPVLVIEAFHIRKGQAFFYMADGSPGLELFDVSLESLIEEGGSAKGSFHAKKAILGGMIKPTELNGSFTWSENKLLLPNINATWAGGLVGAIFQLVSGAVPSFGTNVTIEDVSLAGLAADAGFDPEGTQGRLSGTFSLAGSPGIESTYTGAAHLQCVEARMLPIDPIRQLGDMFNIKELQVLELDKAHGDATIGGGKIHVKNITLATENVILDAQGDSSFGGALALKARFHVSERLRRKTGGILGNKFTASEAPNFSHMPFSITGTIQRPKTDLLDKIVGLRIQRDLGGLLKSFLKFPSDKKKSKSSHPQPTPTPGGNK